MGEGCSCHDRRDGRSLGPATMWSSAVTATGLCSTRTDTGDGLAIRLSPPFSSHLKMWWAITAERRFFVVAVFVVATHADVRAALVRLATWKGRFAPFQTPERPVRGRRRVPRSQRARRCIDFLRFFSRVSSPHGHVTARRPGSTPATGRSASLGTPLANSSAARRRLPNTSPNNSR